MNFTRRNVNKTQRNGEIIATTLSSSIKSSFSSGGGSSSSGGDYLPATKNGDGTYTVNLSEVHFTGNLVAEGEVAAHQSGTSEASSGTAITVYDGLDSESALIALSANQGRVLKNLIDTMVTSGTSINIIIDEDSLADNQILVYNATTKQWENKANEGISEISKLKDVSLSNIADKQILVYNATTSKWENKTADTVTAEEKTKWNNKLDKSVWDSAFYFDDKGNIRVKLNLIGDNEISAYGSGNSTSTGAITIVDNLSSELTDAALSANQGRVLKSLIDNIDMGDFDLSGYSPTSHTHTDYATVANFNSHSTNTTLHITADERTKWNNSSNSIHTHSNKSVLDTITSGMVDNWNNVYNDWNDVFEIDSKGNLKVKVNLIGEKEVSAYGSGTSTSSGAITIVDNLTSTLTDAALSANQGRVLKNLIDNANMGDFDLSEYSKTSHTHSNYSLTSHTHTDYAGTGHTHTIANITNLQSSLDAKSGTGHSHSNYSLTSHTHTNYSTTSHSHSDYATTTNFNSHSGNTTAHITSAERTNWNAAYNNNHTHSNKSVLDGITSTKINNWDTVYNNWIDVFEIDSKGNLKVKVNVIGQGEISAYGSGTSTSTGAITIVDNLTSTLTDAALSANQGRVLKSLIDSANMGDFDLSDYSKTSHTHSNYSTTSHTHSNYSTTGHTHSIANITNLQTTLDGKSGTGHTHSAYSPTGHSHSNYSVTSHTHSSYATTGTVNTHTADTTVHITAAERTAWNAKSDAHTHPYATTTNFNSHSGNTTLHITAAERTAWNAKSDAHSHPYASSSHTHTIANITNLQSSLDAKSGTGHSHSNYSLTSHTHALSALTSTAHTHSYAGAASAGGAATSANKVNSTLSWSGYNTGSFNGSAAASFTIPSNTNQLTNGANFITTAATVNAANKLATARTLWGQSFSGTANVSGNMTGVGSISASGNITTSAEVTAHSDRRLKNNIKPLEVRGELNPVTYIKDGKESIGFIAQDVQELYPELVIEDNSTDERYLSLNYQQLTAVLAAEIKELRKEITDLKEKHKWL